MPNVTIIPATAHRSAAGAPLSRKKRRTAGYGRVSTDEEEQQTSYAAQVEYYTNYIQANPEWEFVKVYAEHGPRQRNRKHAGIVDLCGAV